MDTDFVVQGQCTICWLNRGLGVYLELFVQKQLESMDLDASLQCVTFRCNLFLCFFSSNFKKYFEILNHSCFSKLVLYMCCSQNFTFLQQQVLHAFRVFCNKKHTEAKKVLRSTFWKIGRIHIQIYPQNSIEPTYGAFNLNNEVRVHGLILLLQLSCRVASP